MLRGSIVNGALAALCVIFYLIYVHFSYGADSLAMRFMFLPTLADALLCLALYLTRLGRLIGRAAYNLWNSAAAVVTCGMLFLGIVEISGRRTDYDTCYWIAAGVFVAAALSAEVLYLLRRRREKS